MRFSVSNRLSLVSLTGVMLLLGACETVEGYRQRMSQWEGRSSDALQIEWGVPIDKSTLSDGAEIWVYRRTRESRSGGYWTNRTAYRTETYFVDGKAKTRSVSYDVPYYEPLQVNILRCETRFVIKDQTVRTTSFEGDGCVAEELEQKPAS